MTRDQAPRQSIAARETRITTRLRAAGRQPGRQVDLKAEP